MDHEQREAGGEVAQELGIYVAARIVRFDKLKQQGIPLMFIDSALPGYYRMNYAVIGDTASENPEFASYISAPHKFQIGMFCAPPGCGPAYHAHEWKIWAEANIPDDKVLIPGVLDTTTNFVEAPELVAQRLKRFAAIVGPERVLAGRLGRLWVNMS